MDTSGDGQIGFEEIINAAKEIGVDTSDMEGDEEFRKKLELNIFGHTKKGKPKDHMDFQTFMMAAIDLSKEQFVNYALRAYEMFFSDCDMDDDEELKVGKNELIDIICQENIMKKKVLEAFVSGIDEDNSSDITFEEIITFFIKTLEVNTTFEEIKAIMEEKFKIDLH